VSVASFGYIMTLIQIPAKITTAFLTLSDNRYVILMCFNLMLLMLGTLMNMAALILILTPLLMPVIINIGVDPGHFGMIMLVVFIASAIAGAGACYPAA
jgi:TRAP-type C4-dicarboxylate transport system permease large subunit